MAKWKKRLLRVGIILFILLLLIGAELLYSNNHITISQYDVSSEKVSGSFRIVFLTDLHGREFGENNTRLLENIAETKPDLIAFVGDIFNQTADSEEIDRMCALIHEASKIAPLYFGLGNHEAAYNKNHSKSLIDQISAAGAVVLDNSYQDLTINGASIRLGGYSGSYRIPHLDTTDKDEQAALISFADKFEDTDRYKILLCHIPIVWFDWEYRDVFPVDLVLSGHYHGGIVRIPILEQGLYAPYVGKFPPYTKGLVQGKLATCILSTGMAGSYGIPRFFNPPEIVVVDVNGE